MFVWFKAQVMGSKHKHTQTRAGVAWQHTSGGVCEMKHEYTERYTHIYKDELDAGG